MCHCFVAVVKVWVNLSSTVEGLSTFDPGSLVRRSLRGTDILGLTDMLKRGSGFSWTAGKCDYLDERAELRSKNPELVQALDHLPGIRGLTF
jgi:hypothetical protein